ncbi:MAG: heat-inducible transcriptional repressor HrcA [Desulfovibrio sp.]|uniref:heat-inducible transcriptional repressor HrcA n=1 Tax=Desulfovibrio sp. 7SRBS1 TaxID=3378064 RepID=UPI003B3FEA10
MDLTEREITILSTITRIYIEQGIPVGSRTVSKESRLNLSAATIRNVMADLTDKGYLEQPHTSAGRVPTQAGFRFYLDRVVNLSPLPGSEKKVMQAHLSNAGLEVTDLLRHAGKTLSNLSQQVSMVLSPMHGKMRWRQVEFALIKPTLVMVVIILQGGIIQKKLIELERPVSSDDLVRFSNYLNEAFKDMTISQVRHKILRELGNATRQLSDYLGTALHLVKETVDAQCDRELFVDGALRVLPGLDAPAAAGELICLLEERQTLLDMLEKIMEASDGVLVALGSEASPTLTGVSVIASPYSFRGETLGMVGVIGPLRMDYADVMPKVDFTAQILTQVLQKRF